jgi:acetylglutamate kinase
MSKPQAQAQELRMDNNQHDRLVIKVGGRFFDDLLNHNNSHQKLFYALEALSLQDKQVVLVHGGGEQVQTQLHQLGFTSEKVNGLRITPFEHMPTVAGVLSGYLNKTLVAKCKTLNLHAVGITLADGDIACCRQVSKELGAVGAPQAKDPGLLMQLFEKKMLPIVASIGCDERGALYNINADHAATCIAQLLNAQLFLLSDVPGVLDHEGNKMHELGAQQAQQMIADKHITDGMVVKVNAAQDAADALNSPVTIGSWNDAEALLDRSQPFGTKIFPYTDIDAHKNL